MRDVEANDMRVKAVEKPEEDRSCGVCLGVIEKYAVQLSCTHILHSPCLHQWLKVRESTGNASNCPICQAEVNLVLADPILLVEPTSTEERTPLEGLRRLRRLMARRGRRVLFPRPTLVIEPQPANRVIVQQLPRQNEEEEEEAVGEEFSSTTSTLSSPNA